MKRLFATTVMTVAMMAGGNVWAGEEMAEEYMEPQLHSSMAGAGNPCPHYAGSCRDRVSGWLTHMDAMAEDAEGAMRANTYACGASRGGGRRDGRRDGRRAAGALRGRPRQDWNRCIPRGGDDASGGGHGRCLSHAAPHRAPCPKPLLREGLFGIPPLSRAAYASGRSAILASNCRAVAKMLLCRACPGLPVRVGGERLPSLVWRCCARECDETSNSETAGTRKGGGGGYGSEEFLDGTASPAAAMISSIRSAMRWAGPRNCSSVQSAA